MYRIVNHPCLGQTRLALAQYTYGVKDPVTCTRKVQVEYFHNDGNFYPWPFSAIHFPAAFSSTSAAERAFCNVNFDGVQS